MIATFFTCIIKDKFKKFAPYLILYRDLLQKERITYLNYELPKSNTAVDVIVKALVKFIPKDEILRLVSGAKSKRIDKDIKDVSITDVKEVQKAHKCGRLKILCGTLQVLGKLDKSKIEPKASHIFIDEAGQATESEILVVFPSLLKRTGQLILAGKRSFTIYSYKNLKLVDWLFVL